MASRTFHIHPLKPSDRPWVSRFMIDRWGALTVVSRGRVHQPDELPGFVALQGDNPVGLATYRIEGDECELVTIDSLVEGMGIGTALIEAVRQAAEGCRRLWLITTNDNTPALRFYQKRGFTLAALHRNALEQSRKLKPEIPLIGMDGIPIRDEIELEMLL